MLQDSPKPSINSGFSKKTFESAVPQVENPTAVIDRYGMGRVSVLSSPNHVTLRDIENGYMVDSYIHQAVTKYFERLIKAGFKITGSNNRAIAYINRRLDLMTAASGEYWFSEWKLAMKDYIKLGTGMLVKARVTNTNEALNLFDGRKRPRLDKPPIGAYYAISPLNMIPEFDGYGRILKYDQFGAAVSTQFDADDVIVFRYDRQPGGIYGVSFLVPVLDDVRALRQCEEMVIQLIFKSLNPLIHHEVPDTTGTGRGSQEDVDNAARAHSLSAVNGYLITPPGHKITILGVESRALRAEGYIDALKHRVYAGLGISDAIMGDISAASASTVDGFLDTMNDRVRYFQKELSDQITHSMIWELLIEGGYDPILNPNDRVFFEFNDPDENMAIKKNAHLLQMYTGNTITEDEIRQEMGRSPLTDRDREDLYINRVQIPLAKARSGSEAVSDTGNSANASVMNSVDLSYIDYIRNNAQRIIQSTDTHESIRQLTKEFAAADEQPGVNVIDAVINAVDMAFSDKDAGGLSLASRFHGWLNILAS